MVRRSSATDLPTGVVTALAGEPIISPNSKADAHAAAALAERRRRARKKRLAATLGDDDVNLIALIASNFKQLQNMLGSPVFTTKAGNSLFDLFLSHLHDDKLRASYNCNECRRFVNAYGGLVFITGEGRTRSAFWSTEENHIPPPFRDAIHSLRSIVERRQVTGQFFTDEPSLGHAHTLDKVLNMPWHHFHAPAPRECLVSDPAKRIGDKNTDFETLTLAIKEFYAVADYAVDITATDQLYRGEKVAERAAWFASLCHLVQSAKLATQRPNIIRLHVATAPAGWAHIRSSVLGTLYEDLNAGLSLAAVRERWQRKLHPGQYLRPTAAPKLQTIDQAEKIFDEMGLAPALERRYAFLSEVLPHAVWVGMSRRSAMKEADRPALTGVFAGVRRDVTRQDMGPAAPVPAIFRWDVAQRLTWAKFSRDFLPHIDAIEFLVPMGKDRYIALVTATDKDAPPIIQWDPAPPRTGDRNPMSWYVYTEGAEARQWNLIPGGKARVNAIVPLPHLWNGNRDARHFAHQGEGVVLILEGARDTAHRGLALFPEILRSELHPVRSVIEAHSASKNLGARNLASACGYDLRKQEEALNCHLNIYMFGNWQRVHIDRWE